MGVFLLYLLLWMYYYCGVASQQQEQQQVGISPQGNIVNPGDGRGVKTHLLIQSPKDRQVFYSGKVTFQGRLIVLNGGDTTTNTNNHKVCWKVMSDLACFMKSNLGQDTTRLKSLTPTNVPYHGCSNLPLEGTMVLASTCWIVRFDLLSTDNESSSSSSSSQATRLVETVFRRIDVATIDGQIDSLYPNIPRLSSIGGELGMYRHAVRQRGMGMILQCTVGEDAVDLLTASGVASDNMKSSSAVTAHSFLELWGLPEKWRDGFDVGRFSRNGTISSKAVRDMLSKNVVVHAGNVNETLRPFLVEEDKNAQHAPIGLLLIDLFVESSTSYVLNQVVCRLSKGSIVLFGSYFNYPNWMDNKGERSAWLAAVDYWDIPFETIGYYSTQYMVKLTGKPLRCPGSGKQVEEDGGTNQEVAQWAKAKIQRAMEMSDDDRDGMVRELEEVLAVDPNNGEALGYLAFGLEDIHRISDRWDYARRALLVQHRMPPPGQDAAALLQSLHKVPMYEPPFDRQVRIHRLRHDLDQLKYLLEKDRLPRVLLESAISAYQETLAQFPNARSDQLVTLSWDQWATLGRFFNRALYLPVLSRVAGGGALNPAINFTEVQAQYNRSDPQVVVVDDFLSKEALHGLLRYYREATIFYDSGATRLSYLGTYLPDGVGNPILGQVVEELAEKLRPIICDRPLVQAWAYKYDDTLQRGINIHADMAAVNVNLWLTENESTKPDRGGMVIFTQKPPEDWSFEMFNTDPTPPAVLAMLKESGFKNITVPYKQNRILLFDSKLFHLSDISGWRAGYEKRRINLTLLFGRMGSTCES